MSKLFAAKPSGGHVHIIKDCDANMSAGSTSIAWELGDAFVKRKEGDYKEQAGGNPKLTSTLTRAQGKGSFVIRRRYHVVKEPRSETDVTVTDIFRVIAKFYI